MDRDEIKANMEDCEATMRNEIQNGDHFIVTLQDFDCYSEYSSILSKKQLESCFRKAAK